MAMLQYIKDYLLVIFGFGIIIFFVFIVDYLKNKYFNTFEKQEKYFLLVLRIYWIFFQALIFVIEKYENNFILALILSLINAAFVIYFTQILKLIFIGQKKLIFQYYGELKGFLFLSGYTLWSCFFIASLLFKLVRSLAYGLNLFGNVSIWLEILLLIIPIFGEFIFKFINLKRIIVKI